MVISNFLLKNLKSRIKIPKKLYKFNWIKINIFYFPDLFFEAVVIEIKNV